MDSAFRPTHEANLKSNWTTSRFRKFRNKTLLFFAPRTRNGFGFPANTKKSSKVLTQHNALPPTR
jgi:hypothetical protein